MTPTVKRARILPLRLKLVGAFLVGLWSSNVCADESRTEGELQTDQPSLPTAKPALLVATSKPEPARPHTHRSLLGSGLFLNMGGSLAVTGHKDSSTSATVGGEVSLVAFKDGPWYGGYMDARYDFGAEEGRISVGPEFGYAMFGLDAGVYRRIGPGADQWGLQVRPMLTIAIVTLYGAYGSTLGATTTNFFEGGLLFKVPVELKHWH